MASNVPLINTFVGQQKKIVDFFTCLVLLVAHLKKIYTKSQHCSLAISKTTPEGLYLKHTTNSMDFSPNMRMFTYLASNLHRKPYSNSQQ